MKETYFFERIVILSKRGLVQVKCSPDERAALSHQKSDKLLCKVQMFSKAVILCSRNPIFRQIFVCTRKMLFWRQHRNFWATYGRNSYWNPENDEKLQNCWKRSQNGAPELENAVLSTVNKQGCAWSKYFPLSVPNLNEKLSSFEKLFLFKMIFRTGKLKLWQTCRTFAPQHPTLFSVKSKCLWEKSHTIPRKSKFSSIVHLYT